MSVTAFLYAGFYIFICFLTLENNCLVANSHWHSELMFFKDSSNASAKIQSVTLVFVVISNDLSSPSNISERPLSCNGV